MSIDAAERIDLANLDSYVGDGKWSLFRVLRNADPVHFNVGSGMSPPFWAITRYDDVLAVARNRSVFSSDMRSSATPTALESFDFGKYGRNELMLFMDDPRHNRLRRLVTKGFTPRAIAAWEPLVRESCDALLDRIPAAGECEFLTTVAAHLPMWVICALLGVPPEDCDVLFAHTNKIVAPADTEFQTDLPEGVEPGTVDAVLATNRAGWLGVLEYFDSAITDRRQAGTVRYDLIAVLDEAEIEGDKLTDQEILWFCALLFGAGSETTRNAITGGLLAFCQHPDQMAKLVAEPALLPSAVEEILRFVTPANFLSRWATTDFELEGKTIRKGDMVNLYWSSANRDERVFDHPEDFDITRSPNDHLTFGHGAHFCLGSGVARIELRTVFERMFARFSSVEALRHEWTQAETVNALKNLYIIATPA
jgi:cholest-4-en-3-one 26-monooxygenase